MRKILCLGIGLVFLGSALIPALEAARDRYHSYRYESGKERRFSKRIGPFHHRATQKDRPYWRLESPYTRRSKTIIVERRENFREMKAQNIPFYFSVPLGFEKTHDSLDWNEGNLVVDKFGTQIEIIATNFRCEGGGFAKRYCLRDEAENLESQFKSGLPGMEVVKNELISMQIQTSTIESNKSEIGHYIALRGKREQVSQLAFLEPNHNYLWLVTFKSPINGNTLLDQEHTVGRIINSLFKTPKKEYVVKTKDKAWQKTQTTATHQRRFSESYRNFSRTRRISPTLDYEKATAYYIPFNLTIPKEFSKVSDTLHNDYGEMRLRNKYGSTIKVIATGDKCIGEAKKRFSSELREIRECLTAHSEDFTSRIRNNDDITILDDKNVNLRTTFNQTNYQEMGRLFSVIDNKKRKAYLTFRDPVNHFVWHLEMREGRDDRFLRDAQKMRKVIMSPFFSVEE